MLLALNGYELAMAVVAAVFIVFALVVALVIPRSRPGFPANRLGVFIGICVALFFAQMTAVVALAEFGEEEEVHAEQETEPAETEPAETEPAETEPAEAAGDPAAGKEIFASAGCGSCHALADAGTSGTIGPDLDATTPSFELAVERVTNGQGAMPSFSDSLSEQQIRDVAAFVSTAAGG